jgi:UDP-N-acetylmuramyl pentapeptide phosphotransferase/UDP-N-acetylglucosamine-1-phosphate transferase
MVVAASAGAASAVLVAVLRKIAPRVGLVDVPNERSSHAEPTPRGGGLAIVIVVMVGVVWLVVWGIVPADRTAWVVLAAALGVAAVSFADDLRPVPFGVRLVVHVAAALVVLWTVGWWQGVGLPLLGTVSLGVMGLPVTLLWMVGLTNAYNFMDGIDGIAGAQAVVAGAGWFVILGPAPGFGAAAALLIAAAATGFLVHNWSPARIFMGDVGSAFLGFMLALIPVLQAPQSPRMPLAGLLVVWPFVADTAVTFFRRLVSGERVVEAHRSHLYQRLVSRGWSHAGVALLYAALAAAGVAIAAWWSVPSLQP